MAHDDVGGARPSARFPHMQTARPTGGSWQDGLALNVLSKAIDPLLPSIVRRLGSFSIARRVGYLTPQKSLPSELQRIGHNTARTLTPTTRQYGQEPCLDEQHGRRLCPHLSIHHHWYTPIHPPSLSNANASTNDRIQTEPKPLPGSKNSSNASPPSASRPKCAVASTTPSSSSPASPASSTCSAKSTVRA